MKKLLGLPVANAITEACKKDIKLLSEKGITPKIAIVRVGARDDDIAYECGIIKRFSSVGAMVDVHELPDVTGQEKLEETIIALNNDTDVHGILLFLPLPKTLSTARIKNIIAPIKDVDCMSYINTAAIFEGSDSGYAPCTPQAVMELMNFYGIELTGKKVTVIGRSMVVGRPLSMMLVSKNATVTLCHTKTLNLIDECKSADIIIACAGKAKMLDASFVRPGQIVIDVGINMDGDTLCGDVYYESVNDIVEAITPVPGGVGVVTTSVLLKNTVRSAYSEKAIQMEESL